jgi:hypothetical protein
LRVALFVLPLLAGMAITFLIVGISPFIPSRRGEVPRKEKDRGFPLWVRLAHDTLRWVVAFLRGIGRPGGKSPTKARRLQQSGETDETRAPRTRSSGALVRPVETHETSAMPLPRWGSRVRIPSPAPRPSSPGPIVFSRGVRVGHTRGVPRR